MGYMYPSVKATNEFFRDVFLLLKKIFLWIKKLFVAIAILSFCSNLKAQDNFKIGDEFIFSSRIHSHALAYYRENINLENCCKASSIWKIYDTSIHSGSAIIYLKNNFNDSLSYYQKWLLDDFLNKRVYQKKTIDILIKKYGLKIINKLLFGLTWIGMNTEQAELSLGFPDDVNTTKTKNNYSEQWVYNGYKTKYYYFENGKLTTIQD